MNKRQTALIILDGWGYREDKTHNAIASAKTPNFDRYWAKYPHTLLAASGLAMGLPDGQMGNSEIGHTTIGAGKAIDTDLVRINKAIDDGSFYENPVFLALFEHVKKNKSTLHVQGLIGDGGVHSHHHHLFAFLRAAKKAGIERVAIHCFTDGRDTPPQSAGAYLEELEEVLNEVGIAFIATVSGRFFAMDRDNNWDRLEKVEKALFKCEGNVCQLKDFKVSEYIKSLYKEGKMDEHIEPIVCHDHNGQGCTVAPHDAVFFFNFRPDRARMLSKKILEKSNDPNSDIIFATMTSYGNEYSCPVAYPANSIETTLAKELSLAGITQAHIAETEKFPHATYFLNGGVEKPHEGEEHVLLESRKDIPTHDLAPKMRAEAIADEAIKRIESGVEFIFINFANPDMVGHTANIPAIIEAIEETDLQMGRVVEALIARKGIAFITADHGNAEVNVDPISGEKHTAHTLNLVPAILTSNNFSLCKPELPTKDECGTIADIAPTLLTIHGVKVPEKMTGKSLLLN